MKMVETSRSGQHLGFGRSTYAKDFPSNRDSYICRNVISIGALIHFCPLQYVRIPIFKVLYILYHVCTHVSTYLYYGRTIPDLVSESVAFGTSLVLPT